MRMMLNMEPHRRALCGGFSLLEVIVAAGLLSFGLLAIVRVFPYGLQVAQRAEDVTRASLLARTMFEGLKADSRGFPIIPGDPFTLIPLPGNGHDDDDDWATWYAVDPNRVDLNRNGRPDVDFDGFGEAWLVRSNGVDDDGDGISDDDGDGGLIGASGQRSSTGDRRLITLFSSPNYQPFGVQDGNLSYDPEPQVDEEWCNGVDDDGDGLIDEDTRLASTQQRRPLKAMVPGLSQPYFSSDVGRRPLQAGDGIDNGGVEGEKIPDDGTALNEQPIYDRFADWGVILANGIDDNQDGKVDEGIDERVFGLGSLSPDMQMARFPWGPMRFPAPNDRYAWQVYCGPVSDTDVTPELAGLFPNRYVTGNIGDGVDDDGDGTIDEEIRDGLDNDADGRIDEDCIAAALPGWLKVVIVISWGGDGLNNDAATTNCGQPTDPDGSSEPPEDRLEHPDCAVNPRLNLLNHGPDYPNGLGWNRGQARALQGRLAPTNGHIAWGIDEEMQDGIDNDFDGLVDEDTHLYEFRLTGFISLRDRSRSFPMFAAR